MHENNSYTDVKIVAKSQESGNNLITVYFSYPLLQVRCRELAE